MRATRVIASIAVIALFMGVAVVGDALAGEKVKFRAAFYRVKVEAVPVGDEEGHLVVVVEDKGIATNLEGKKFLDGWALRQMGLSDANRNVGTWSSQGYTEFTDPDGDKIYVAWQGKRLQKDLPGEGTVRLIKGTGKWQGIQGTGKWRSYYPATDRLYSDVEWDVEWPR
ncbi:MAG: hypothetical protein FJY85_08005 [Deltaproteobacteria bacterium]|nr:hypothetical protein [Deltaproteobacteria bacterium]